MPAMLKAAFPTAITVGGLSNSGKDLRTASAGSAAATPAVKRRASLGVEGMNHSGHFL